MKEVKTVIYKAFTGKEFETKEVCLEYERYIMEKMAKVIKEDCEDCVSCEECRFYNKKTTDCILEECPCDWELD